MIKSIGYVAKVDIVTDKGEYTLYLSSKNRTLTRDINKAQFTNNMDIFRGLDGDNVSIDIATIKDVKDKLGLVLKDSMFIGNPLPYVSLPEDKIDEEDTDPKFDTAKCINYDKETEVFHVDTAKVESERARMKMRQDTLKRLEHESVESNIYNSTDYDSHTITMGRFIRNSEGEPSCRVTAHSVKMKFALNNIDPEYYMTIFESDGDYYTHETRILCDYENSMCIHKLGRIEAKTVPTIMGWSALEKLCESLDKCYMSYVTIDRCVESNIRDAYKDMSSFKEVQMCGTYSQILRSSELSESLRNTIANAKMNVIGLTIYSIEACEDIKELYEYVRGIEVTRYDDITEMINNYSVKTNIGEEQNA